MAIIYSIILVILSAADLWKPCSSSQYLFLYSGKALSITPSTVGTGRNQRSVRTTTALGFAGLLVEAEVVSQKTVQQKK